MDPYPWLRFAHVVGLMLISAGLIGVFVLDMRSRQVRDLRLFAQAVTFIVVFYGGLVVSGALLLLASGTWLIAGYHGGWDFLEVPWLAGMVFLFAFEFIEGNTITRRYFLRLRRLTRRAVEEQRVTPELARARGEGIASFTHFLDLPILLVIVSLGVLRPDNWTLFTVASAIAVAATKLLNFIVPRLYPWSCEELRPPGNDGTGAELQRRARADPRHRLRGRHGWPRRRASRSLAEREQPRRLDAGRLHGGRPSSSKASSWRRRNGRRPDVRHNNDQYLQLDCHT